MASSAARSDPIRQLISQVCEPAADSPAVVRLMSVATELFTAHLVATATSTTTTAELSYDALAAAVAAEPRLQFMQELIPKRQPLAALQEELAKQRTAVSHNGQEAPPLQGTTPGPGGVTADMLPVVNPRSLTSRHQKAEAEGEAAAGGDANDATAATAATAAPAKRGRKPRSPKAKNAADASPPKDKKAEEDQAANSDDDFQQPAAKRRTAAAEESEKNKEEQGDENESVAQPPKPTDEVVVVDSDGSGGATVAVGVAEPPIAL